MKKRKDSILHFCDECGQIILDITPRTEEFQCPCGKYVCRNHNIQFHPIVYITSDREIALCKECWEKGSKYREMESRFMKILNQEMDNWIEACRIK